jgi:hypothetical protein
MGISFPELYEPCQAAHEESVPELCISEVDWELERTYEIREVGADLIIAIFRVKLLSQPSTAIHLEHALVSLRWLQS